jgi:hypothetical protein
MSADSSPRFPAVEAGLDADTLTLHTVPAPYFRLKDGTLCAGPLDRPLACFREGCWHTIDPGCFHGIVFEGPVRLSFQNQGRRAAAARLMAAGVLLRDRELRHRAGSRRRLVGLLTGRGGWRLLGEGRHCDSIVLESATPARELSSYWWTIPGAVQSGAAEPPQRRCR